MDDCERLAEFYRYNESFINLWHQHVQHNPLIPSHPFPFNKDYRFLKLWLEEMQDEISPEPYQQMIMLVNFFIQERSWIDSLERRYG